jgi:hypothetical protein
MAKSSLSPLNIAALITEAARAFDYTDAALDRLLQITSTAISSAGSAIFGVVGDTEPLFVAGRDSRLLKERARIVLCDCAGELRLPEHATGAHAAPIVSHGDGPAYARVLLSDGQPLGVWAVMLPGAHGSTQPAGAGRGNNDLEAWETVSDALAPMMVLGLRQQTWQDEVKLANTQVERRIREVGTVYEIGRAIDRVDIQHLLRLITERAAAVMDAQACSLLIKQPPVLHRRSACR